MLAGQAVLDSRWAFEQVIGHEAVTRALGSLPGDVRDEYEQATSLSWVSYGTMRAVHDAYAREAREPIERLLDRAVPLEQSTYPSDVERRVCFLDQQREPVVGDPGIDEFGLFARAEP